MVSGSAKSIKATIFLAWSYTPRLLVTHASILLIVIPDEI